MNPEDIKTLIDYLIKSGEILGTKIYALAYRQALSNAIITFFWSVVFIAFILFTAKLIFKLRELENSHFRSHENMNIFERIYNADIEDEVKAVSGVLSVLFLMMLPFIMDTWINFLINPEWSAIENIFNLLSN